MASSTNINGFNIGGNNNSFDQRGHFYRAFLDGNVSGMLVKQNSTPNMTVLVEHGSALLNKNTISASVAEIKSDVSVTIDTANTANPRIDSIVIYEDTSIAIPTVEANYWQDGAGGRFKIVSLPGTAAASPVALTDANIQSAIGAGKPWARLADITLPANTTTILNSNINNSVRNKLGVPLTNLNGGTTVGVLTVTDTSGNVMSTNGIIGVASVSTGVSTAYAATIPSDDSIPQVTEGTEILSLNYTPTMIGSKLLVSTRIFLSSTGADDLTAALFTSASSNAVGVGAHYVAGANYNAQIVATGEVITTSKSEIKVSVRTGGSVGSTRVNGVSGNRRYGGAISSSLQVMEIAP